MPLKASRSGNIKIKGSAIIFLSLLTIAQSYWLYHNYGLNIVICFTDAIICNATLYGLLLFVTYSPAVNLPKVIFYCIITIKSLILSIFWISFTKYSLLQLFPSAPGYENVWQHTQFIRGVIGWILIGDFSLFNILLGKLNKLQDSVEKEQKAKQLRKDAELFKLRQQLQPHFLFNSLNSINALIVKEPAKSRKMIQQLSDYLRNTMKKEDDEFISIQEELSDLRLYLAIEQVRFGHRLQIQENIEIECEQIKIPPFLIQPLVENAIKYGLYGTIGNVHIIIDLKKKDDQLIFSISNPYDADAVSPKGTGFGLESIRRRLYLLFARNDLLKIEQGVPAEPTIEMEEYSLRQFVATLIIPILNN